MINRGKIEVVKNFTLLGSTINAHGSSSQGIKQCIALGKCNAKDLFKVLKSKDVTLTTKMHLTQAVVFSIASYAHESRTISKEDLRIDAFELWHWQRILNIPWTANRMKKSALEEVQPKCSLEARMARLHFTYFGHVIKRDQFLEKDIMLGKVEGQRKRVRPSTRWIDTMAAAMGSSIMAGHRTDQRQQNWNEAVDSSSWLFASVSINLTSYMATDGNFLQVPLRQKPRRKTEGFFTMSRRRVSCKDLGHADCQGWLFKKKAKGTFLSNKWKKFWVVLKESSLYWYSNQMAEKADGFVNLPDFTVERASECKKKHAFKISHPEIKTFYFAAENLQEMNVWLNKLGLAVIHQTSAAKDEECYSESEQDDPEGAVETPPPPYSSETSLASRLAGRGGDRRKITLKSEIEGEKGTTYLGHEEPEFPQESRRRNGRALCTPMTSVGKDGLGPTSKRCSSQPHGSITGNAAVDGPVPGPLCSPQAFLWAGRDGSCETHIFCLQSFSQIVWPSGCTPTCGIWQFLILCCFCSLPWRWL
ncbi:interactor protein for cytohesin exchange factors 1 isoform X17 [Loxodonta africana]|uniref:interactor protein for cytohesin exchange factors 1 isoform X17 n=1 Tax=Loxodonta africana TaxID=9785 RepID=UPI0030D4494E